jgi:hypothetical protein
MDNLFWLVKWACAVWPATLLFVVGVLTPFILFIIQKVLRWLDDNERTFDYSVADRLPFYKDIGEREALAFFAASFVLFVVLITIYAITGFIAPLWILLIPLPFILVKKVFRLGKVINKHINDKQVHK